MSTRFFVKLVDGTFINTCDSIEGFYIEKETGLTYLYNEIGRTIGAVNTDHMLSITLEEEKEAQNDQR